MPKMKTRKSISKRVKRTGTGKVVFQKPGARHLMTGKSGKKKRQMRNGQTVPDCMAQRMKKALPYG